MRISRRVKFLTKLRREFRQGIAIVTRAALFLSENGEKFSPS